MEKWGLSKLIPIMVVVLSLAAIRAPEQIALSAKIFTKTYVMYYCNLCHPSVEVYCCLYRQCGHYGLRHWQKRTF
jgi:hypothetical protein